MGNYKHLYQTVFGEELKSENYKLQEHSFVFNKRIGKSVFSKCGLVYLKNPFTEWSVRTGCYSEFHPSYQQKRKLTNVWM